MDELATMGTIGSSFRPRLFCQGICLLNRHQTGDTDSVQPVLLLPVQRDSQETFLPCEAHMLWYSADRTSSQQLRDTTGKYEHPILQGWPCACTQHGVKWVKRMCGLWPHCSSCAMSA